MHEYYHRPQFAPFSLVHDDPAEPPVGVMLVHGFTGSPMDMRPLAKLLHERGADCHAIGLPGHGQDIANLQSMTATIWHNAVSAAWQDHTRRYTRTILIGYSMGGSAAIQIAASQAPDMMVLLAPFVRINDRRATFLPVAKHLMKDIKMLEKLDFENPVVRQWMETTLPGLQFDVPEIQRQLREESAVTANVINEVRKFGVAARRSASKVTCPVVVLQGHQDVVVNPRDTRNLCDRFPSMQAYHEMPADHLMSLDTVPWWPRVRSLVLYEIDSVLPSSR